MVDFMSPGLKIIGQQQNESGRDCLLQFCVDMLSFEGKPLTQVVLDHARNTCDKHAAVWRTHGHQDGPLDTRFCRLHLFITARIAAAQSGLDQMQRKDFALRTQHLGLGVPRNQDLRSYVREVRARQKEMEKVFSEPQNYDPVLELGNMLRHCKQTLMELTDEISEA